MIRGFKLPAGSTLRPPRRYTKSDETYSSGHARWCKRWDEYTGAHMMAQCFAVKTRTTAEQHLFKAYYGLKLKEIIL